jgi:hypothetical protein
MGKETGVVGDGVIVKPGAGRRKPRFGDLNLETAQGPGPGQFPAVHDHRQSYSDLVPAPVPIPDHREVVAVIIHALKGEIGPVRGNQRIHDQGVAGSRTDADQSGDDQVHESGVEIVLRVVEGVVPRP